MNNTLNDDDMKIIHAMAECDLNTTATARKLFVHRNTVVYRIQRIRKKTGCDIRKFYDMCRVLDHIDNGDYEHE